MLGFLYAVHSAGSLFLTGSLLGLLVGPEDEGFSFLQNVGELLPSYTALQPRRLYSS
jgi:hypothetical protein